MTSRIRFKFLKTLITALLNFLTWSTNQQNGDRKFAAQFVASDPCLPSLLFHDFSSWLRLIAQSMQWNISCETHELLWILNFQSYSPGSATVLSQFKFQPMLSCKLLKQSNLLSSHSLPESHKQIRGYILCFLSYIRWKSIEQHTHSLHCIYCYTTSLLWML